MDNRLDSIICEIGAQLFAVINDRPLDSCFRIIANHDGLSVHLRGSKMDSE